MAEFPGRGSQTELPLRLTLSTNAASVQAFIAALRGHPKEATTELADALRRFGRMYQTRLTRERLSGQKGDIGLNRVTGHLARSLSYMVVVGQSTAQLRIMFGAPYAIVHEKGGLWMRLGKQNVQAQSRGPGVRRYKPRLGAMQTLSDMLPDLENTILPAALANLKKRIDAEARKVIDDKRGRLTQ